MSIQGINPRTRKPIGEPIAETTEAAIDSICAKAHAAFAVWPRTSREERAVMLDKVTSALDASTDELAAIADDETALGLPRLTGEIKRTTNQVRLFASVHTRTSSSATARA